MIPLLSIGMALVAGMVVGRFATGKLWWFFLFVGMAGLFAGYFTR